MAQLHKEIGAEVSLDYTGTALSASAVASTLISAIDVSEKGQMSTLVENNETGGGETLTVKVWESHNPTTAPALVHAGATGWAQLGADITLAPGDREPYSWTTRAHFIGMTMVATGAITTKILAGVISAPPS